MLSIRNLIGGGALAATVLAGSAWIMDAEPAQACIHPPKEFKYPIKAGSQKGLIFFADGRQEMVIRPSYKVEGEGLKVKNDAVEGFTTVAWVIPTPSLPDRYEEADEELFKGLADFTEPKEAIGVGSDHKLKKELEDLADEERQGAEFLEEVSVGDYTIQPIKAHGEIGGMELKGWLTDNGFGAIDDGVIKHYLDNDYYWLAVKLHRAEGLPANGDVKPLHIGFDTDKPVYPIKINQGRGEFDLELWLITNREVDTDATKAFGLKTVEQQDPSMYQPNRETKFSALPESVRKIAVDADGLKKLKAGQLHCYRFFGSGLNETTKLDELSNDLSFEFKEEDKSKDETDE